MGLKQTLLILCMVGCLLVCSGNTFVQASTGWIHVSSSIQGSYYEGRSLTISWSSSGAGSSVSIELYRDDTYYTTISSSTSNTGWYYWQIPTGLSSSKSYQIKITSLANTSIYDFSNNLYIYKKSITVTSPAGGETWYTKEPYEITWTSSHVGTYVYIGYNWAGYTYTITSATYDDGSYMWTPPSSLTLGSSYRIYIKDYSDSTVYDYSEYFTIDERYITIQSPSQGATMYAGDSCTVEWDAKNAGDTVALTLNKNYVYHSVISSSTSNDGSYIWEIPANLESSSRDSFMIDVASVSYSTVSDTSGRFSIVERSISITSPEGGEVWYKGKTYTILWDSSYIGSYVDIDLYENGKFMTSLSLSEENDGFYEWTVPSSLNSSSGYAVKITSTTYEDVYAVNSGYISVQDTVLQQWLPILVIVIAGCIAGLVIITMYRYIKKRLPAKTEETSQQHQSMKEVDVKTRVSDQDFDQIWEQ